MKISPKQYAIALYDLVEGKTEKEISVLLVGFSDMLRKNNAMSKLDSILKEFSAIWNKENGIVEATVTLARDLDGISKKSIIEYIKKATKATDVHLKETVDKSILGGVVLKYGDKIVDNSLRGRIESLGRSLEK
ncbi:MAG: ATP synthase F1 subunit delta [Patescibacteria group bacterium]|nr:ATP synthase F1 subunit delta [Patescibacteria group bacterium]